MNKLFLLPIGTLFFFWSTIGAQSQTVEDDFEGNGTITSWYGDNCNINTSLTNPYSQGINTSATVMEYHDVGGQYANVRFDVSQNYDLSSGSVFSIKIYVPGSGLTGSQTNQVSLKLQDGTLTEPWLTQCEIIKPIVLDQWQSVSFDFSNDGYINLDPNSLPPTQRSDFNRVLIQVNGENNYDQVLAYIDDVSYNASQPEEDPEYDLLVWSDEFDTDGAIDDTKWHQETLLPTATGWHNGEIQHYTDRTDNANVSNGKLHIIGKKETYTDQGVTKEYTSARLNSKFAFKYGKVEVRAKLPAGVGTWPAIWMLGKNLESDGTWWDQQGYGTTPLPDCGEIDIMEHWGANQNYVQSATHTLSSYGGTINKGGQTISTATTEFHTYTLRWYPEKLVFSVDGVTHYTYQPNEFNSDTWPFNAEQYLLLNFAFLPEIDAGFVADTMEIDYVRVYQSNPTEPSEDQISPYTSDENTILLMHFDGDLTNASPLSEDGTAIGSGLSYSSNAPENFNQCIRLDGSSYLTVPHHSNLNLNGDWAIEAWINITAFNSSTQSLIVQKPGDTDSYFSNYALELNPWMDNILHGLYFINEEARVDVRDMSPELNKWYHVAFIRNVSNSEILINIHDSTGTLISSTSQNDPGTGVLLNTQDLRIGEAFEGSIDELRISNVVRSFPQVIEEPFPTALDQERIENKVKALNLHRKKDNPSEYQLNIAVLSAAEYELQKPADALPFDCGYVNDQGKVYVSEPTTAEQLEVFTDIDLAAIYYMCQSFLQHYYLTTEMPLWFKTGFAAYESDMRMDDAVVKTAYNNYNGTLTSFDALNDPTTFEENNGLAVSYLFGEFMGVYTPWKYYLFSEVNATTVTPASWWDNVESIDKLFSIWSRYFNVRILETNEQNRIKLGNETEHFKYYYREADDFWAASFPTLLEDALNEYIGFFGFNVYEKFSYITMPECDYFAAINGLDCINRYTGGTAWSSGLSTTTPSNSNDIYMFEHLIRHELAHLVQTHLPVGNMTAWLNEGFAEFLSRTPDTQAEKEALKNQTQNALDNGINYFGHLPTFEDTKVYPGQSNVDYYLLGRIMLNFIYEKGGYAAVKDVMLNYETGIANLGFSSLDDFMNAYYYYLDIEYLQKEVPDYFTDYDLFIAKLTELTSSVDYASQLDVFWNDLLATGNFPFTIGTRVAFLYRGTANTVSWAGDFNEWDANADTGTQLGVSNIWLLEKEFPSDARSGYKIVRNGSEWIADENNPYPLLAEYGNSDLRMPDYQIPPETIERPSIPKGTLSENFQKYSTNLGYTCQYKVYTPAGYSELSDLPVIYVTDGQDFSDPSRGKMKIILDNLIYDGTIEPVIAVFLDPRDPNNLGHNRRSDEYRNNINFVDYVTQELVPDIDADYKTNATAGARAIAGFSYGGYNAAYFCAMAPEYIQNTAILSPIMHPNPPESGYSINEDMMAADLVNTKIYMSYGIFDTREVGYFNQLKNIFDQKGKAFEYDIVNEGHTMSNWSGVIGNALQYFFSNVQNSAPVISEIPDQTEAEGSSFATISLDSYVSDADNTDSEITWSFSGNTDLTVAIDASRIAEVTTPNSEWSGNETITFTASDPSDASASVQVTFTMTPVNDTPVMTDIPDQTIEKGNSFTAISLDNYVSDQDNAYSEITWTYSGNDELQVAIDGNRVATVSMPQQDWTGSETITFTATDPQGEYGSDAVVFTSNVGTAIVDLNDDFKVAVYPNPASEKVHIKVAEEMDFYIFTISGQKILEKKFFQSGWIDVSDFRKGIYIVSIKYKNGMINKKLIVE